MSEPEHAPDTPAHAAHAHPPVRILWWIYFALLTVDWLMSVIEVRSILQGLEAVFWGVGLVGLIGYLRRYAIGWHRFWAVYLALYAAWVGYNTVDMFWRNLHAGLLPLLAATLGVLLVFGPLAWALWRYVSRCPSIWRRSH